MAELTECAHEARFSIMGYETAAGDDLDAVDYCPTCASIRLWGVGWMAAPEPSVGTKASLLDDAQNKCPRCQVVLGASLDAYCDDCYEAEAAEVAEKLTESQRLRLLKEYAATFADRVGLSRAEQAAIQALGDDHDDHDDVRTLCDLGLITPNEKRPGTYGFYGLGARVVDSVRDSLGGN